MIKPARNRRIINKATAISPANIAFIKYWGKRDSKINLPFNNSISMNLNNCLTITTVEFSPSLKKDTVFIDKERVLGSKRERVIKIIDIVRKRTKMRYKAMIVSQNNFPADAGIASSAAAFSALALASSSAAGLSLDNRELSILARLGSGSACRSIPDGFSEWRKGTSTNNSFATQLAPPSHWKLVDIVTVVADEKKKASSTHGHSLAVTSPYFKKRQREVAKRVKNVRECLIKRQFERFGHLIEEEAIDLHLISMSSRPPVFYWNKGSIEVIHKLHEWRGDGLKAFFTMDAGPNMHVICQSKDSKRLDRKLRRLPEVLFCIVNKPARGTKSKDKHLF